jgi:hypothetical protein
MNANATHVHASHIDAIRLKIDCPFCYLKYFDKDNRGVFQLLTKPGYHYHGSRGDLTSRQIIVDSHCPMYKGALIVHIDDNTQRVI